MQELIIGVGIVTEGKLYTLPRPHRHHHCISIAFEELNKQIVTENQGFITNKGRYVLREEALEIAKNANQLLPRHDPYFTELFSESIW